MKKSSYAKAGVDIDAMEEALDRAKRAIHSTKTRAVLSSLGSFGGLFVSPGREMVLVSSVDGVGTKLKVAEMAGRHDTVGQDLVNHCVNDILVQGAHPLFFLDYIGTSRLDPAVFAEVVGGMAKACRANGCALIGGETAELPGLYPPREYDLVGCIVGAVRRRELITGRSIRSGDVIIGLPSSGLHTNGYSLARKIVFEKAGLRPRDRFPGTRKSVAEVFLAVHRSYLKPVQALMKKVRVQGMAHITGGGLLDNVPRIMPKGLCAVIDTSTWRTPVWFQYLREAGDVDPREMYRVFNMGIGMTVFVRSRDAGNALSTLRRQKAAPLVIGRVEKGAAGVGLL